MKVKHIIICLFQVNEKDVSRCLYCNLILNPNFSIIIFLFSIITQYRYNITLLETLA